MCKLQLLLNKGRVLRIFILSEFSHDIFSEVCFIGITNMCLHCPQEIPINSESLHWIKLQLYLGFYWPSLDHQMKIPSIRNNCPQRPKAQKFQAKKDESKHNPKRNCTRWFLTPFWFLKCSSSFSVWIAVFYKETSKHSFRRISWPLLDISAPFRSITIYMWNEVIQEPCHNVFVWKTMLSGQSFLQ